MTIGILAFGSLIDDPGQAIAKRTSTNDRIPCVTPFRVEFARLSDKRGGAPTLIPVKSGGANVQAKILVFDDGVTLREAKTLLWRRETRKPLTSTRKYREPDDPESHPNKVLVRTLEEFHRLTTVLYTDFPESGKRMDLGGETLAESAIKSLQTVGVEESHDGITYLIKAKAASIMTPLLPAYEQEILRLTETSSLQEAFAKVRNTLTADEHEEARRRAFLFAMERGGRTLPPYDYDAVTGDFWRAAG